MVLRNVNIAVKRGGIQRSFKCFIVLYVKVNILNGQELRGTCVPNVGNN